MDRTRWVLSGIDTSGLGLEIGPSYNPTAPKSGGYDIRVLDHTDRQGLVDKYRALGLAEEAIARIEDVDYVWEGEPLRKTISSGEEFDYVVASHVVEHSVDLIGFLNQCAEILTESGTLVLVVPDQRYCFDHFRPLTSAGQAVEGHLFPRIVHGPASFIDTHLYTVRRYGADAWHPGDSDGIALVPCRWEGVGNTVSYVMPQDTYIDIHRWVFTPASFELLMRDLRHLGYLDLVLDGIDSPGGFEFRATMRLPHSNDPTPGSGDVSDAHRWELLKRIESEQAEGRLLTHPPMRHRVRSSARRRLGRFKRRLGN